MSNFTDKMDEVFNISPYNIEYKKETLPAVVDEEVDDLESDFKEIRNNYKDIIEKGTDALDDILAVARESENPRAFEVASTIMQSLLDANEKLIDLHKKIKDTKTRDSPKNVTNALFIGSTAELSKLLKDMKKEQ